MLIDTIPHWEMFSWCNFHSAAYDSFDAKQKVRHCYGAARDRGSSAAEHCQPDALSNLYLAASQVIPPEQREQDPALDAKAAILEQSFFRLLRLVNSMSAAEYLSDSQTLSLRDADLVKLVSEVCESSADLAEQLGIQLKFVCAMDRRVCAIHPAAVEQMLYHLLSNALKFTPAGGAVTVELKKSGETLRLTVSDTGCGIPPERMAHLFDGCFQPGHPTPAPYGLGLGLPLCRAIAEKHGGSITVESAPGKGSRFMVSLPDRQLGSQLSDIPSVYNGGFSRPLLATRSYVKSIKIAN